MSDLPLLSILIPTHARRDMLEQTLLRLPELSGPTREIIVIDDASNDGTAAMLTNFPAVRVLRNDPARGFDALPEAVRMARGTILLQLDDDAFPCEGTLERVAEHFARRGPRLGLAALPFQEPESGRLSYSPYFPKLGADRRYGPTRGFHAGAVAARREACLVLPLSPPGYFMYGTEVPTVIEFLNAGWEADYVPEAPVVHHWEARGRSVSSRAAFLSLRNDLITIQRYYRGVRRSEMMIGRYLSGLFHLGVAGRPQGVLEAARSARAALRERGEREVSRDILERVYPAFEGTTLRTFVSETNLRRVGWFFGLVPIDQIA